MFLLFDKKHDREDLLMRYVSPRVCFEDDDNVEANVTASFESRLSTVKSIMIIAFVHIAIHNN